jgi:hypothetical protein
LEVGTLGAVTDANTRGIAMKQHVVALLAGSFTLALALPAAADTVCIQIDTSKDSLSEGERMSARTLLGQAFEAQGQPVVPSGCQSTYTVFHVRLGTSVSVFLSGPRGSRDAKARTIEELPEVYSQMVRSIVTGQPMATANDTVTRNNVTTTQMVPARVEADSLWYLRLGFAGVLGSTTASGPQFGFGYRYELDNFAIDASFLNLMVDTSSNTSGTSKEAITGDWIRLMGLYFFNPVENRSAYLGAGLSWGVTALYDSGIRYSGNGLQAQIAAGYEVLRASTIRLFIQADASLPFYTAGVDTLYSAPSDKTIYAPVFGISLGLGWGRANRTATLRVIQ